MKIVSLIPARGGSKGIPDKALREINDKSLIQIAVNASSNSFILNETYVSSDSPEILYRSGLNVKHQICRPIELAQDDSSLESVIEHFNSLVDYDICVLIQCTSPMITNDYIDDALNKFIKSKYDSMFSCFSSNDMLIWREDILGAYNPVNYNPFNRGIRQSREESKIIVENGMFYIFTREIFERMKCRLGGKIGIFEIPFWKSFEIDKYVDLENVRKLMNPIKRCNRDIGKDYDERKN